MSAILFFITGVFFWTFLEYVIHRFAGHRKKAKNPFSVEHMRHHREGNYFSPTWKKVIAAMVVLLKVGLIMSVLVGIANGIAFAFGLAGMYLVYEWAHKRAHTHGPMNNYGRWMRLHHFYHHFKNPKMNHGVTSPIWDWVFGTLVMPSRVRVPKKMALPWLVEDGDKLKVEFAQDYRLV